MANNIKKIADEKGIKIIWLSRTTGIARSHLYDIMANKANPSIITAYKISNALDTDIKKLFPNNWPNT